MCVCVYVCVCVCVVCMCVCVCVCVCVWCVFVLGVIGRLATDELASHIGKEDDLTLCIEQCEKVISLTILTNGFELGIVCHTHTRQHTLHKTHTHTHAHTTNSGKWV